MTSRMALGSVSTLAVGAMLLGAMPYLVSRTLGQSHGAPWGSLSGLKMSVDATGPAATVSESDRAQLVKLASLKSAPPASAPAAPVAAAEPVAKAANTNWSGTLSPVAAADPAPQAEPANMVPSVPSPVAEKTPAPAGLPQNTTALEAPSPPVKASPLARAVSNAVNINTASMEALDAFPGVGRIGHAIMIHRPYRSVADLMRKRVLRTSDFEKIQSRIRVD